ncbi:MAG: ABC transporter ATP-binding protein [Candidatus Omnitrophota bacterium]
MQKYSFSKTDFRLFLEFLRYLLPYRKKQLVIFFLSGISILLTLVNPYLSKLFVDNALIDKQIKTFIVVGAIGVGVFILNGLIKAAESFISRTLRSKLNFDLNKRVFKKLQELPLEFFQDKSTGEHMFRISNDITSTVDFIVSVPDQIIRTVPSLIFILVIIFYLDWQMASFSLILTPILYLPIYYFTGKMRVLLEEMLSYSQHIFKHLAEVFSHMYLVKSLGREQSETRKYLRAVIKNIRISLKSLRLEIISSFVGSSLNRILIGLITLFGAYQVFRGRLTAGTLTAILLYLSQMIGLQNSLANLTQRISLGLISCKRLKEILYSGSAQQHFGKQRINIRGLKIGFHNISFGYRPKEHILNRVNFSIDQGWISLAGASGCGKSTIINLLLGLYQPWLGEISIDGFVLRQMDLTFLKEQIGIVLQEPFLWNDTVENNIRYLRPTASREQIEECARISGVGEFLKDLPQGYKSLIGENACRLSEGQKQKIAIARALINEPKILILDEAMSSMDSSSEEKIIQEIKKLPINIVIIVSHRLSSIAGSDLVYFLKNPNEIIIDQPLELIKKDKEFNRLFAAQLKDGLK